MCIRDRGGNTMRSGGYFNAVVPENQQTQVMTAGQIKSVEEYCTMEPKDDIMKNWQEKLTAEFDEYKKSGAEHLFDSVYLHMLQTYVDGDYVGNPVLIQSMCEKAPQTYALSLIHIFGQKLGPDRIQQRLAW